MSQLNNGEFSFPDDFNVSAFESNRQSILREAFEELTQYNAETIARFDPKMPDAEMSISISLGWGEDIIEEEPLFAQMLVDNMLRKLGIHAPTTPKDTRSILSRRYGDGVTIELWHEHFDAIVIPVQLRTKPGMEYKAVESVQLLSYEKALTRKAEYIEYGKLWSRMRNDIGMSAEEMSFLVPLNVERMRQIVASYDEIQNL